jgi:hypothetical protein
MEYISLKSPAYVVVIVKQHIRLQVYLVILNRLPEALYKNVVPAASLSVHVGPDATVGKDARRIDMQRTLNRREQTERLHYGHGLRVHPINPHRGLLRGDPEVGCRFLCVRWAGGLGHQRDIGFDVAKPDREHCLQQDPKLR